MSRVTATLAGAAVSADLRELAPADQQREAPATHRLVSLYVAGIEPGASVEIDGTAWTVVSVTDPADALLLEAAAVRAAAVQQVGAHPLLAKPVVAPEAEAAAVALERRHAVEARRFLSILLAPV